MSCAGSTVVQVRSASAAALVLGSLGALWLLVRRKAGKRPPKDWSLPIVGETLAYVQEPSEWAREKAKRFGGTFAANVLGGEIVVLVPTPVNVKFFSGLPQHGWPEQWATVLGPKALPMVNGALHKRMRTVYGRSFTPKALDAYLPVISGLTAKHLRRWAQAPGPQDARPGIKLYTFDLAQQVLLGVDSGEETEEYMQLFDTVIGLGFSAAIPLDLPGLQYRTAMNARRRLGAKYQKIVDAKRAAPPEDAEGSMLDSVMFASGEEKITSDEQLVDFCAGMIFAGHDTTLSTMQSFFHTLDKFPEVQEELRKEVETIWDGKSPITRETVKKAHKIQAFSAEVLRMEPTVPRFTRTLEKDAVVDGYFLKKGSTVGLMHDAMRMASKVDDPEQVKLERHLDGNGCFVDRSHDFQNNPTFGAGARMCIGYKFASDEMVVFLLHLLHGYEFQVHQRTAVPFPLRCWSVSVSIKERS